MGRKLYDEEYKQKLRETNPEFESLAPYQGSKVKIPHRHIPCGYVWDVKPNVLDQNTYGCPMCSGKVRKDIEYFKKEVEQLVGDEYSVIGDYVNTHTKTTFRHNVCGNEFDMTPHHFVAGQRCRYCQHRSYKKTTEEFKEELFNLVGDEYTLEDEYINGRTKVNFRHKLCGQLWNTTPNEILSGYRCAHCYGNTLLSQEEFEKRVYEQRGDEYTVVGKYVNFSTKVAIRHNKCGCVWDVQPATYLGKQSGCPKCNQSKGEARIERFLIANDFKYTPQMKYEDLVGINNIPLSYDFYLHDYNLLIEYQGQQHEKPVDWFGGEEKFKRQKEIDKMKSNYAKEHNIELMEIWYWDFDNIGKILESRLLIQQSA